MNKFEGGKSFSLIEINEEVRTLQRDFFDPIV